MIGISVPPFLDTGNGGKLSGNYRTWLLNFTVVFIVKRPVFKSCIGDAVLGDIATGAGYNSISHFCRFYNEAAKLVNKVGV